MSDVGSREVRTQQRVIEFLREGLGYEYLGHWKDRDGNAAIEEGLLRAWLLECGHDEKLIARALHKLHQAAAITGSKGLYDANRDVYAMLRYGVKPTREQGKQTVTIPLVDWDTPENNHFAVAEEVTVAGEHRKRPDLVLYVNGIALAVLELKRSTVSVSEGIRQSLDSQKSEFIRSFFAPIQLVLAGNESEGLRYGVIETPEKYWLRWKEEPAHPAAGDNPLLRELGQVCSKARLLEIVHDFIVFDAGVKKVCRHNQYFGVREAQEHVRRREGGIVWHTQGSGKSLTMVWLAKWIRENIEGSRVLVITDRTELDEQIEKVFKGVDEDIHRTKSGADLVSVLDSGQEWLVGSLLHKFGASADVALDEFLKDVQTHLPKGFRAKGELFVFVDECHRSHSNKLHEAMKELLPDATLIGFTGTPLLKTDKRRSIETFGPYIHTYKYDEAVRDGVVLDLRYEARDIDQTLASPERVDAFFESKTQGLTDVARAKLKERWGTLKSLFSAKERLERIVQDILLDMSTKPRLESGHGNAILVAGSIYSACRFYELFQRTELAGKCAIVTSYRPQISDIKGEETGEGETEKLLQYEVYRRMLARYFDEPEAKAVHKAEQFETDVKKRFVEEPGKMKLLIVVDKLLTGFDAPPATYLYIDKSMQDHGLFQAICRVNRLDGDDKEYGYIVDYKDLFRSLERSIQDYTGEALDGFDKEDVEGLLKDRIEQGRERLEEAREAVKALCEPVAPPRDSAAHRRYFCGERSGDVDELAENAPKRVALYRLVAAYIRAYANLANDMAEAGYTSGEAEAIRGEVAHYESLRQEIKLASGDHVDMKMYEPAMRQLLDNYVRASDSESVSAFEDMTLVELIVERGADAVDELPKGVRIDEDAVAETIENNVRRLIIDEMDVNPAYYERMSALLDALIERRRQEALAYKAYLAEIVELARRAKAGGDEADYPPTISTAPLRALYDNLDDIDVPTAHEEPPEYREGLAVAVDREIRAVKKANWRGNRFKEREVRRAIERVLPEDHVDEIFDIVKAQHDY